MSQIFAEHYRILAANIMHNGYRDVNKRTGAGIKLLPQGHMFSINLGDDILPTCGIRRTRPHIAAAEVAWCLSGVPNVAWLRKHTKVWDAFADDNGNVMEAYGYRWKHSFGYDQIQTAIGRLTRDSTDRRVWISSWDPMFDLIDSGQKTVPCPVGFTLSKYAGCLNSTYVIRSSDVFMGLPYDIMRHALLMRAIANSIPDTQMGFMSVMLAHPHIYETHFKLVEEMIGQEIKVPYLKMPGLNVADITNFPDDYVRLIKDDFLITDNWPDFDPKVTVVK